MNHRNAHALFGVVALVAASALCAQTYPSRPVRLIVPFPPGGGTDIIARIVGQKLGEAFNQQVVIDNRGGAGGIIGTELIAKAAPDGHSLGMQISGHSVNPALYRKLPYDSIADFTPITLIAHGLYAVVVHPSVPAKTLKELVAHARANPAKINVAIAAAGSPGHLAVEQFKAQQRIDLTNVLYKGSGPAVADLIAGHAHLQFASYPSVLPYIKAGRLRALCVTSAKRSMAAPDVATAIEQGFDGFTVGEWYGVVGPARMDKALVVRLNAELAKVLGQADVRERLLGMGADIVAGKPEEFGAFIQSEIARWGKVVRDAGIKVD